MFIQALGDIRKRPTCQWDSWEDLDGRQKKKRQQKWMALNGIWYKSKRNYLTMVAWDRCVFLLYFFLIFSGMSPTGTERKPVVPCSVNVGSGVIEVLCWGGADWAGNKTPLMLSSQDQPAQASMGLSAKALIELFCCLQQQRFSEQIALLTCL